VALVGTLFLVVDLAVFGTNLLKIPDGGWFPLLAACFVYLLMSTWRRGRLRLSELVKENTLPIELFLADIGRRRPYRVPGVAVFLTPIRGGAPPVLLHHLKHNKVLHEKVMLLSVIGEEIPQVPEAERVRCHDLGEGFYEVIARFGFMETPDVPAVLQRLGQQPAEKHDGAGHPVQVKVKDTTFYLGRETLIVDQRRQRRTPPPRQSLATAADDGAGPDRAMARWRKRLFVVMSRNAQSATAFFGLPPNRVVELGAQIQF
jgi:KUP system potassium uptake protein